MSTYDEIVKANATLNPIDVKGKPYSPVTERIKAFRMVHPDGQIATEIVSIENGVCIMRATVANSDGQILGTGTAYENENSSFINKTSYIENCETSAVGRALGMAGYGIDASMASADELLNAMLQQKDNEEKEKAKTQKSAPPANSAPPATVKKSDNIAAVNEYLASVNMPYYVFKRYWKACVDNKYVGKKGLNELSADELQTLINFVEANRA